MLNYLQNLWNALDLGSLQETLLRVASVLICLILHETCHGVAAFFLGDPTAKRNHRLSLNPLRHIDWLGLAAMVLTGVGWAKPVPVNPNYFKHPKLGMAITALAGPLSNLLLALWLLLGVRVTMESSLIWAQFLMDTAILSIGLGVFNLIPIPPLDGSKVLAALLPDRQYRWLMRYERFGMLIIMLLVVFGALSGVVGPIISEIFRIFCRIVGLV
ncbi:MAG: site-2 protease family protein [Oscillospiraceae bacterium]|nr:site-2 protease family protein [Oscillospiraceae bacterium]